MVAATSPPETFAEMWERLGNVPLNRIRMFPPPGTATVEDVERLCNAYIPAWLASDGMSAAKISQFYDDPEKCANDAQSLREAFDLRSMSIDTGLM